MPIFQYDGEMLHLIRRVDFSGRPPNCIFIALFKDKVIEEGEEPDLEEYTV